MTKPPANAIRSKGRPLRADAQRNMEAILSAAKAVFETEGVDAPVRDIAAAAGVGMGTLYRHFPQRADLISGVLRSEIDACADAAATLAAEHDPIEALHAWILRYAFFIGTKRGLSSVLHSGDPAYKTLPDYFEQRFKPVLRSLLAAAAEAGEARSGVDPDDLLNAIGCLGMRTSAGSSEQTARMVSLLVDGLRYKPDR
ncbi:TetR/AcrR family transcriptional regulator [Stakelama sp. CBK3Z-3]|uniref:TetR/AcrR family transcriptional regulator n=1 Tax=Stakelama flava TaxID=2860338 RepID=A0ABS6XLE0_9SPHN|nr:TetR/AcrR family transcriptional regulator [Stakelama flava]MBW4330240.1 TetR/AcrR family transcriptional regulator [Stakelama flava]